MTTPAIVMLAQRELVELGLSTRMQLKCSLKRRNRSGRLPAKMRFSVSRLFLFTALAGAYFGLWEQTKHAGESLDDAAGYVRPRRSFVVLIIGQHRDFTASCSLLFDLGSSFPVAIGLIRCSAPSHKTCENVRHLCTNGHLGSTAQSYATDLAQ